MTAAEYYKTYIADDNIMELNRELLMRVVMEKPIHCLEFGSGTGKHIAYLERVGISGMCLDISFMNMIKSVAKNDCQFSAIGNETHLRHLCNFDVVFTCSVLDHIEHIDDIVAELVRICNKCVIIAETNSKDDDFYYKHDYEKYGFVDIGYEWLSPDDSCLYKIWRLEKPAEQKSDFEEGVQWVRDMA
jgi:ubiquinone/menaquinone biosynthesis C-methylase UbiE